MSDDNLQGERSPFARKASPRPAERPITPPPRADWRLVKYVLVAVAVLTSLALMSAIGAKNVQRATPTPPTSPLPVSAPAPTPPREVRLIVTDRGGPGGEVSISWTNSSGGLSHETTYLERYGPAGWSEKVSPHVRPYVSVYSEGFAECRIVVDGNEIATQYTTGGTATCRPEKWWR